LSSKKQCLQPFRQLRRGPVIEYVAPERMVLTESMPCVARSYSQATTPLKYVKNDSMGLQSERPYFHRAYDSKARFISYWHQINAIMDFEPQRVLEVGVGSKFVSRYLRDKGVDVVTLDSDEMLEPDIVACVTSIPLQHASFDVVSCCQVLEHLPYGSFRAALEELKRVTTGHVLLSLPDSSSYVKFSLQFSNWAATHRLLSYPHLRNRELSASERHHWEIGRKGYPLWRIKKDIRAAGLHLIETYRIYEHPFHRFFILEK
jgi:ubiquinone/menaquinone biosynthesis C-methylase UbiE